MRFILSVSSAFVFLRLFVSCYGRSNYEPDVDDFSTNDNPNGFGTFPNAKHKGEPINVEQFVNLY